MATTTTDINIQTTVMAIREELMNYFKGGCVQTMVQNSPVQFSRIEGRTRYQYEREEIRNKQPRIVNLGNAPIMTVQKSPDKVTLHAAVLNRSPQFRAIREGLEEFLDRYLIGVTVEINEKGVTHAN